MQNNAVSLDKQDSRFCDYIQDVNKIGNVIFLCWIFYNPRLKT